MLKNMEFKKVGCLNSKLGSQETQNHAAPVAFEEVPIDLQKMELLLP